jgi:hypothetical protein
MKTAVRKSVRFAVVLSAVLGAGCGVRYRVETRRPELLIQLSISPMTCASPGKTTAEVYVFIHQIAMPPGTTVDVELNGRRAETMVGQSTTVYIARAGYGGHTLIVRAGGVVAERYFSVWNCGR